MGSTDSIPQNNSHRLNRENWQVQIPEQKQLRPIDYGNYTQLKNNMTGEQLDQYQFSFSVIDDYNKYMQIYNFRNQHQYLVPVVYINQEKIKQLCINVYQLKVYIEHFSLRLCHIQEIPFPENLYVLLRALKGFQLLYNKIGHFHITEDLFCINDEGLLKVWINSDLSKDYPQRIHSQIRYNRFRKQLDTDDENSMIWEVITIVNQYNKKSEPTNRKSFIQFLTEQGKSRLNFKQTINLVQKYSKQVQTQIPQVFQSAIKKIRQKKGIFQSQVDITLNNRIDAQDIQTAIRKGRLKQSEVERVPDFKNNSMKSYVASQSNHTYADKLKKFDNQAHNNFNLFGVISGIKDTPIKKTNIFNANIKQLQTQRPIANLLSFSEISSPHGTQSLPAIGNLVHPSVVHISSSNSQVIQNSKSIGFANQSQSPMKQKQKPQTYFSQYIQQQQFNLLTNNPKRQYQFSFGQQQCVPGLNSSRSRNQILRNIPIVKSMVNSKADVRTQTCQKPIVTFSYSLNPSLKSSASSKHNKFIPAVQSSIPISPPSIDRSLITKMIQSVKRHQKIKQQQQKNEVQKKQDKKRNSKQSKPIRESQPQPFQARLAKNQIKFIKQIQIKAKQQEKGGQGVSNTEQLNTKSNLQAKQTMEQEQKYNKDSNDQKIKNLIKQNPQKSKSKHKQIRRDFDNETKTDNARPRLLSDKMNTQQQFIVKIPLVLSDEETPIVKLKTKSQKFNKRDFQIKLSKNKLSQAQKQQLNQFLLSNCQLGLDPEIAADLIKFQSKKRKKEKQKQSNKQQEQNKQ